MPLQIREMVRRENLPVFEAENRLARRLPGGIVSAHVKDSADSYQK
jgi:hypothetical protein